MCGFKAEFHVRTAGIGHVSTQAWSLAHIFFFFLVLSINPEDFPYLVELVLAGGNEQLASQHSPQKGTVDKVIVKGDVDISEVVLDVPARQALRETKDMRVLGLSNSWRE